MMDSSIVEVIRGDRSEVVDSEVVYNAMKIASGFFEGLGGSDADIFLFRYAE
jgi:hypothetical protein